MKVRIREARKSFEDNHGYKMTQEKLAELSMPDSKSSLKSKMDILNRMQRGDYDHPSLDVIERIAIICEVDFNFLFMSE